MVLMRNSGIVLMVVLISLTGALAGCTKSSNPTPTSSSPATSSSPPATSSSPPATSTPTSTTPPTNPTPVTPPPQTVPFTITISGPAACAASVPSGCVATAKFTITAAGWKTAHFTGNITTDPTLQSAELKIVDSAKGTAADVKNIASPGAPNPGETTSTGKFQFDLTGGAQGEFTATLTDSDATLGPGGITIKGNIAVTY